MLTDRMLQVCELVVVKVRDHVIIGDGNNSSSYFLEQRVQSILRTRFATSVDELKLEPTTCCGRK